MKLFDEKVFSNVNIDLFGVRAPEQKKYKTYIYIYINLYITSFSNLTFFAFFDICSRDFKLCMSFWDFVCDGGIDMHVRKTPLAC